MDVVADEITSNTKLRENLFKGPKYYSCLIGLGFLLAGYLTPGILSWIKGTLNAQNTAAITAVDYLTKHTDKLTIGGLAPLALGITLYVTYFAMHKFWAAHIDPHVQAHINRLASILEQSGQNAQEVIAANSLELAVRHSEPETVKNTLKTAYTRAYGTHCDRPKGLYQAIQDSVGKYLEAKTPHRSTNHQHIVIDTTDDGKFEWKESTTYLLHTIAYDTDFETPAKTNETVTYDFNTSTSANYSDLASLVFKVSVDKKTIADTTGKLKDIEFNNAGLASLEDGLITLEKLDGGEVKLSLQTKIKIKINKPEIKIKIEEVSIIEENFFVARRDQPVCGQTISIQIPDNYKFDYLAVPPGVDEAEAPTALHRNVKMDGWIMPGIIFSCQWSPEKKNS